MPGVKANEPRGRVWLTPGEVGGLMVCVSEQPGESKALAVSTVILVDHDAFNRWHCVLRHLAVGLVDQAISLRWLSADPRVRSLALGPVETSVHRPMRWTNYRRQRSELLNYLEPQPPTIVQAMSGGSYKLAGEIATALDADLVLTVSSSCDGEALRLVDPACVKRFVVTGEPMSLVLVQHLRIAPEKIVLIRPGVLTGQHVASFGDPDRTVTLLCTSPFERHGGVEHLIEAIHALDGSGHKIMAFLLGRGRQESMLRRMVRDRGLLGRVTFSQAMDDPTSAMHGADIYVDTSTDPAFREHSLQAMANGLVVVANTNASIDHLRDGETAHLCPRATPQALIDTIEGVLRDPAAAHQMAVSAQQYVREHHPVSAMAEQLAAVYRKLAVARATFSLSE